MKLWIVRCEEYSGYECNGHWQTYIVAADTSEQASDLIQPDDDYNRSDVKEFILPKLDRLRKPRIII